MPAFGKSKCRQASEDNNSINNKFYNNNVNPIIITSVLILNHLYVC